MREMSPILSIGLPKLSEEVIEKLTEDDIVLKCQESNEAMALGYTGKKSCDLTSDYLAGMISTIFGREFTCCEKKCTSKGDSFCVFDLKPVK